MSIDFSKCRICCPSGKQLLSMYRILWELFPYDRPVYDEMIKTGASFYTLKNYALYQGDEFLGNVGLMPMTIWFADKPLELIGVGAVATVPEYRRQGIAKYLMEHCMEIVDAQNKASVLFTELPIVYQQQGFTTVPQKYIAAEVGSIAFGDTKFTYQCVSELNDEQIEEMDRVYQASPMPDGKVIRDKAYWKLYKLLFNPYPKPRIVLCRDSGNVLLGYLRFETESDRFTITEFCVNSDEITEGLLGYIQNAARENNIGWCSLALAPGHAVLNTLHQKGVVLSQEPAGVRREIFMVRPAAGQSIGELNDLQWSLADKF